MVGLINKIIIAELKTKIYLSTFKLNQAISQKMFNYFVTKQTIV